MEKATPYSNLKIFSHMQEVQKAAVPLENVEESPDTAEHEEFWASFEGFCDITLCAEEGKQENRQPIKLFVQDESLLFFYSVLL